MKNNEPLGQTPGEGFRSDIDASHLIKSTPKYKPSRHICSVTVRAREHQKIQLGNFTAEKAPKGFSVEITPEPQPTGSVTTQITSIGTSKRYRLIMFVANYSNSSVTVEVRQV